MKSYMVICVETTTGWCAVDKHEFPDPITPTMCGSYTHQATKFEARWPTCPACARIVTKWIPKQTLSSPAQ